MKHYSRQRHLCLDSKSRCEYPELLPWLHPHSPPNHIPSDNTDFRRTARSRRYVDSPQSQADESLVSVAPNLHQQLYLANDASQPVNYCDEDTSLFIGPNQAVWLLPRRAKHPNETGSCLEARLRLLAPDRDRIGGCQHSRLYLGSLVPPHRTIVCLIISPRSLNRLLLCNHG
jgi:hypothetical protein